MRRQRSEKRLVVCFSGLERISAVGGCWKKRFVPCGTVQESSCVGCAGCEIIYTSCSRRGKHLIDPRKPEIVWPRLRGAGRHPTWLCRSERRKTPKCDVSRETSTQWCEIIVGRAIGRNEIAVGSVIVWGKCRWARYRVGQNAVWVSIGRTICR